jgi:thiamine biosynthesis lipoprotein
VKESQRRVDELEDIFNAHRPKSEVSQINIKAQLAPVVLSADMLRVVSEAKRFWEITDGAFDFTVGPLINIWKKAGDLQKLPGDSEINTALSSVGSDKLLTIPSPLAGEGQGEGVKFAKEVMQLALGGIAKGDIVDQVATLLQDRGVERGVVAASGDILAFGDGTFSFGIQDPTARARERVIGKVDISEQAIVTSGNYERFVEIDGKKYSHILDPKTGWPVDNGLVAVTVIGGKCIEADALATGLMVLGRERSIDLLRRNPKFRGVLIEKTESGYEVWTSKELLSQVHFEKPWADWVRSF